MSLGNQLYFPLMQFMVDIRIAGYAIILIESKDTEPRDNIFKLCTFSLFLGVLRMYIFTKAYLDRLSIK